VNDRRQYRCNEPSGRKLCDNLYAQGICGLVKVAITIRCVGQANGNDQPARKEAAEKLPKQYSIAAPHPGAGGMWWQSYCARKC